nr:histone acetyltransferase HAC1-like isoform X1 [Tanacetum cinerariifolium]
MFRSVCNVGILKITQGYLLQILWRVVGLSGSLQFERGNKDVQHGYVITTPQWRSWILMLEPGFQHEQCFKRQSCVIIYEPRQEEDGRKHNRKGSMKSSMSKRALKASGQTDLSSNASKDILLMHRVRTSSDITIWSLSMIISRIVPIWALDLPSFVRDVCPLTPTVLGSITEVISTLTCVTDEVVYKKLDDSLVRVATTASSLEAEQDSGNINKTQSKATPNESSSQRTDSSRGPRCHEAMGDTIAQTSSERVSKLSNDSLLLVSTHDDAEMFDVDKDLHGEEVFVAKQDEDVVEKEVDAARV